MKWQNEIALLTNIRETYQSMEICNEVLFINVLDSIFRNITDNKPVKYVSKAAKNEAKCLGIDLVKMNWDNQSKVDPKRKIFHYEHCIPIKQLRILILQTNIPIKKIINMDFVCWILKKERNVLDKKYKDHRDNWKKCFAEFGIEPILNK